MKSGCAGYKEWTDCGYEYDCEYEYAGEIGCDDCIFGMYGGKSDPRYKSLKTPLLVKLKEKAEYIFFKIKRIFIKDKHVDEWGVKINPMDIIK